MSGIAVGRRIAAGGIAALIAAAPATAQQAVNGTGAQLRALDKLTGVTRDVDLRAGDAAAFSRIQIELAECRYPQGNPAGDAFALMRIRDRDEDIVGATVFEGWMVASSPALNPLDHPRYDVWVLGCTTS